MKLFTTALFLPLVALTACASTPKVGGAANLAVVDATELPSPERSDIAASTRPYYVGPLDKLNIDVFGIPELAQREVQVDSEGRLSFPLAGTMDVAGLTPPEIENLLVQRLRVAHVRQPQVTVNLKEMVSQRLTIEGEVKNPGMYPITGKMTLLRAIALSEGTTEFSKLSDVVVFRSVAGKNYAALYNLNAIRHGAYQDPDVYPGDIVMVGESRGRRLFKDLLQVVPVLTSPLIIAVDRLTK